MNYYELIKKELISNEIYGQVKDYSKNRRDLETRYDVGKLLYKAGKHYGEKIIKEYSIKLTSELGKGYDATSLKRMRQFYLLIEKGATMSHQLSWSHWIELLPCDDLNKISYYIKLIEKQGISIRKLRDKIKSKEYERLPNDTKLKLSNNENTTLPDIIPNPIIINNPNNIEVIKEKTLQMLIMENISSFLKELGTGFTFIDNEYPIKINNNYNYIDLLLFNIEYNCYVVIELKINELKKQDIGQIEIYMNYINTNLKKVYHGKTIGIILCKKDNKFIIEYSSDKRILSREYLLN